ncbi:MAG: dephospho-CoA kinase [Gallionellales bacterium GWA2_60_142]|nr:MAG: dephospho-CoA kinase [Gallionellales bacterium GWA2_60_142]HCI13956.1 dephospho-CoA kinase [Gallionellaceae bacterium]
MTLSQADSTNPEQARDRCLVVGLTGGIGSGKSTVATLFAEQGAAIIDTDSISRRLTQSGGIAIPALRAEFGDRYIGKDGALDRSEMRALVFSDPAAKSRIEQLLHPLILVQTEAELAQAGAAPYAILVVPLLHQAPAFRRLAQRVLVVDCDEQAQLTRVVRRSGLTETEVRAIIASQTPRAERLALADDIIRNDGDLDGLAAQVAALHRSYMQNND